MSTNPPPPASPTPTPGPGSHPPGSGTPGAHPPQFKPASNLIQKKAPPKLSAIVGPENVAVVTLLDSRILDETNINELGRQLMDLVKKQYMIKMVIDMGHVQYLSSAVLRQFIALYKAIKEEKGDLKLCKVAPAVRDVFKITQLDKMIEITEDLDTAINSFKLKKGGWGFLTR